MFVNNLVDIYAHDPESRHRQPRVASNLSWVSQGFANCRPGQCANFDAKAWRRGGVTYACRLPAEPNGTKLTRLVEIVGSY
jgi:hypothetical protein